jgi:hypothetical protein
MKPFTVVQLFIPAAFCALISMMALFMGEIGKSPFCAFLPMCFFFTAAPMMNMSKRIAELEAKLKDADAKDA